MKKSYIIPQAEIWSMMPCVVFADSFTENPDTTVINDGELDSNGIVFSDEDNSFNKNQSLWD